MAMSSGLIQLLGTKLVHSTGTAATGDALKGKGAVALFFSAQWFVPCQKFAPQLAQWYSQGLRKKGLEVVLVSSDHSKANFDDSLEEMAWLAIPYADRDRCNALTKKFKVTELPSVVILDADGRLITRHGRMAIASDPKGSLFPWRPRPPKDILASAKLINKTGATDMSSLEGKVLGLYFGGKRSPLCREFSTKFVDLYSRSLRDKGLEVIFLSADEDEQSFREYYAEFPWLALDFSSKAEKEQLATQMEVKNIPSLVLLDVDGSVITMRGIEAVNEDPEGLSYPWRPKPVAELSRGPGPLNDGPVLIALCEACSEAEQQAVEEAMTPPAQRLLLEAKAAGNDPKASFVIVKAADTISFQLRSMMSLPQVPPPAHEHPLVEEEPDGEWVCDGCGRHYHDEKPYRCAVGCDFDFCQECHTKVGHDSSLPPVLALVDMDANQFCQCPAFQVTPETVEAFVQDLEAGSLQMKTLRK